MLSIKKVFLCFVREDYQFTYGVNLAENWRTLTSIRNLLIKTGKLFKYSNKNNILFQLKEAFINMEVYHPDSVIDKN